MVIVIDPRFNGPPASANGGYACGVAAEIVGEPAEVTLRRPPPLGRPLRVERDGARAGIYADGDLVAEAARAELDLVLPDPVSFAEACEAATRYPGLAEHAYPTCFVCGPAREDGLRIFTGRVRGRELFAAPWVPEEVSRRLVWAALDCPGAIAVGGSERGEWVLGRLAARVDVVPHAGERCVVVAWPLGRDGRKGYAGTALFSAAGQPYASARQTWIEPLR